jgi:HEAT repeat protein
MNTGPPLTLALVQELSNRALQSDYLNHLDRTAEIANLLSQIEDRDLALRIINLALTVDLFLGCKLTASASPEIQTVIVEEAIAQSQFLPIPLQVALWHETAAKSALPYLIRLLVLEPNAWYTNCRLAESVISAIIKIDRNLAIDLLCKELHNARFHSLALEKLAELAPVEAIEDVASILATDDFGKTTSHALAIKILGKIGSEPAITAIREALKDRSLWWENAYIQGLGIVAEPAMVEHLLYLLSQPEDTEDLAWEAINALEAVGERMFEVLHRTIYWLSFDEERPYISGRILEILFKWDSERTVKSLEGALQSYDPVIRRKAAMAMCSSDIPITDRNLLSLLDALDFPDMQTQLAIACDIRGIIYQVRRWVDYDRANISPEVQAQAILLTKPILVNSAYHPDSEIRNPAMRQLLDSEPDERALLIELSHRFPSDRSWILDTHNSFIADLSFLLTCLDDIDVANIDRTDDQSILSILLQLIDDPEIKIHAGVIHNIVALDGAIVFPTLLTLVERDELVVTLIHALNTLAASNPEARIFEEFRRDQAVALKFLMTAERAIVKNIQDKPLSVNRVIVELSAIGDELAIDVLRQVLMDHNSGDAIDDAILILARIGTTQAVLALLSILPAHNIATNWLGIQLCDLGGLGIIPHLQSTQRQIYCPYIAYAVSQIQERESLYNPEFSDNPSHPLFQPKSPRLRDILLGNSDFPRVV